MLVCASVLGHKVVVSSSFRTFENSTVLCCNDHRTDLLANTRTISSTLQSSIGKTDKEMTESVHKSQLATVTSMMM
jgi:hypothetical protein